MIYNDASPNGLTYVLMQDGKVVAYASKKLKLHEINYPTHDVVLVVLVLALKKYGDVIYMVKVSYLHGP